VRPAPAARLRSLDVFRGATVALMILVNNPGNWGALYPPLAHAPWHGLTPTDLVFPFFLFAVGNALALVMPGLQAAGAAVFWPRVFKRTLLIFAIGLLLNAAPFVRWDAAGELVQRDWQALRIMGVLQRIALCFGAAAALVWWLGRRSDKPVLWAAAALLLAYWLACEVLGRPGDVYSLQGWFGTAVDRALLGESHLYRGEGLPFDPEGLASTAPAIAQVLLGWWVGRQVLQGRMDTALVLRLFVVASALAVLAYVWQLAVAHQQEDLDPELCAADHRPGHGRAGAVPAAAGTAGSTGRQHTQHAAVGALLRSLWRNPLFVFVLSGLVPRALGLLRWQTGVDAQGAPLWTSPLPWAYQHLFAGIGSDPRLGSFLYAAANLSLYAVLAWWLDRRRIYIRV
jgi:predicted acyltransferase